jgi:hypothetical protein
MQETQTRRCPGATERADGQSSGAAASGMLALPAWESFQAEDRCRLVQTILQAARRQVEQTSPADRRRRK